MFLLECPILKSHCRSVAHCLVPNWKEPLVVLVLQHVDAGLCQCLFPRLFPRAAHPCYKKIEGAPTPCHNSAYLPQRGNGPPPPPPPPPAPPGRPAVKTPLAGPVPPGTVPAAPTTQAGADHRASHPVEVIMEASDVADEEGSFATVLETFLERAVPKRDELLQRSEVRHNAVIR